MSRLMSELMLKQVAELRSSLLNYRLVPERPNPRIDYSVLPNSANLIVFGPAGSGKSSLIRTFYRALHNTSTIPKEVRQQLLVKGTDHNEGTTLYTAVSLKPEASSRFNFLRNREELGSSSIKIHDTRGQIWMDSREVNQLGLLLEGRVKDMSLVEQRNHRYAYLLWEFWKKDTELFPAEIMRSEAGVREKPHCILFVFDGSLDEIPNGEEETAFYRDIFQLARQRGYTYPQIVLTRVDKVEKSAESSEDAEARLREVLDLKIESVVLKLGVPRSSVHFIENYHAERTTPDLSVDFHVLRLLHEAVQQAESFLQASLTEKSSCSVM
jgi:GTPase SAR1 family protein